MRVFDSCFQGDTSEGEFQESSVVLCVTFFPDFCAVNSEQPIYAGSRADLGGRGRETRASEPESRTLRPRVEARDYSIALGSWLSRKNFCTIYANKKWCTLTPPPVSQCVQWCQSDSAFQCQNGSISSDFNHLALGTVDAMKVFISSTAEKAESYARPYRCGQSLWSNSHRLVVFHYEECPVLGKCHREGLCDC